MMRAMKNVNYKMLARTVLLSLIFVGGWSHAAAVDNFYTVSALVNDQSRAERSKGLSAASKEMLVRLSGSTNVLKSSTAQKILSAPARYVKGYRYEKGSLVVSFQPGAMEQTLVSSGLPVWSKNRPETLIWLAIEGGRGRYIVKNNSANLPNRLVQLAAQRRGLPLMWPLNADIDSAKVEFADIKGAFVGTINRASEDYQAQSIVLGYVRQLSGQRWQAQWRLLRNGQTVELGDPQGSLQGVIDNGINALAHELSQEFAVAVSEQARTEPLRVEVKGADTLERYAQARKYLESLVMTERVGVDEVTSKSTSFQLILRGSKSDLQRAIKLGSTMRVVPRAEGTVVIGNSEPDVVLELL